VSGQIGATAALPPAKSLGTPCGVHKARGVPESVCTSSRTEYLLPLTGTKCKIPDNIKYAYNTITVKFGLGKKKQYSWSNVSITITNTDRCFVHFLKQRIYLMKFLESASTQCFLPVTLKRP